MTHSGPIDLTQLNEIELPTERRFPIPRSDFYLWVLVIGGVLAAALLAAAVVFATQSPVQPTHTTVQEVPYVPGSY